MSSSQSRKLDLVERILDRSGTRLVLASLVVLSVLPLTAHPTLERILLPVFATEFFLRLALLRRSEKVTQNEVALLVADGIALLTFLPVEGVFDAAALRLVRLARLVVLARFFNSVLSDLRRILSQRQIRYQLGFLLATVLLLTLVGGTVLSTLEVEVDDFDSDGDPDRGSPSQVLWWTFRQLEDPGNLIENSHGNILLLITSLVLTIAGVFVMSFTIGIGSSVVGSLMAAARRRRVPQRDHTVVIGGGRNVRDVLEDLVELYGKNRRKVRIAVLDKAETPPSYLEEPRFRGVEYRTGEPTRLGAQQLLATDSAKRVLVLNDEGMLESADAYAVSSVLAVRQTNSSCPIVVEMRHRRFLDVARVAGDGNINPIPMGKFLGCLMSQNLMTPGIDEVFEELLTAHGSEIYTHIFTADELDRLSRHDAEATLDFFSMLLDGHLDHSIIYLGVLLGDGSRTTDVGQMTVWLNPLEEPPEPARQLGGCRGRIPLRSLRGVIAVAQEYQTVRRAAISLLRTGSNQLETSCGPETQLSPSLCHDMTELRRVLVLGDGELLPGMVENTAAFVPGVEFIVVVPTAERAHQLAAEFRRRSWPEGTISDQAITFPLAQSGRLQLFSAAGDLLGDALTHPLLDHAPLDVVVLIADRQEVDPDAGTALTLLRLLELHRDGCLFTSARFRVVAEVLSAPKGELLERRLGLKSSAPVRLVPTQQMRSYFLVHSAYVPGLDRIHLELLTPRRQDFCQLQLSSEPREELSFDELLTQMASASPPVIVFALKLADDHEQPGLVLNPEAGDSKIKFYPSQVEALYAVGETEHLPLGDHEPQEEEKRDDVPQ